MNASHQHPKYFKVNSGFGYCARYKNTTPGLSQDMFIQIVDEGREMGQ